MKIRLTLTGQTVEVSDEYGKRLIEEGVAASADAPKKEAPARSPRTPRKTAQKPAQTQE